jgi:SAM-dependent methyltransferase
MMREGMTKKSDGSAGDVNYQAIGGNYSFYRQPEPRIAAKLLAALGDARRVLNVGAGAGSYEPTDRDVVAIEPSASMRAQRPPHLSAAVDATAQNIPFADDFFDASMATFTVHQWSDLQAGLEEMRRVTKGPIVILTCDPLAVENFWLNRYAPDVLATEGRRYPPLDAFKNPLGGELRIQNVAIPLDCKDGFNEAYYGRPEKLLDPGARLSCSAWSFVEPSLAESYVANLAHDLKTGAWDLAYGQLRRQPEYSGSLRLILAPGP